MDAKSDENEIRALIKSVLAKSENVKEILKIEVVGSSEKGDGYMGDVIFVEVVGETENDPKKYNLVLKCGKKSEALRASAPVKEAYENEIYAYETVFPKFKAFESKRNVENGFDNVPKCFGFCTNHNQEVLILENLKSIGYELYDKTKPVTSNHTELVLQAYGKWHAISVAMLDQEPENFRKIADKAVDVWGRFVEVSNISVLFSNSVGEVIELLKATASENSLKKFENLKNQIPEVFEKMMYDTDCLKVLSHGDCWNNNFMYLNDDINKKLPKRAILLDWQLIGLRNPVYDLSYFLYATSSKDVLVNVKDFLKIYYDSFSNHLRKMGSDPEKMYPFHQLLKDWKKFGKFGVILSATVIKAAFTEKEEIIDIAENADKGMEFNDIFKTEISNKTGVMKRMSYILDHAIEQGVVD